MRRAKETLIVAVIGVVAVVVGLSCTPPTTAETEVGKLSAAVRVGTDGTQLDIPPLGSVRAETHAAPIELRVRLERLELRSASKTLSSAPAREEAVEAAEEMLHWAFVRYAASSAVASSAVAALIAMARRRRSKASIGVTAGVALGMTVAVCGWTMATFDPAAFATPTFQGSLAEAPAVLKKLDSAVEQVDALRNRLAVVTEQLATLTAPLENTRESMVVLHVSDLHSNAVGAAWVNELVKQFDPDVVIDTGDVTSFGVAEESRVVSELLEVPRSRYLVAFGNHDSVEVRRRLAERLTSIHGRTVVVNGVSVLGLDDPTYTVKEGAKAADDPKYARSGEMLSRLCEQEQPVLVAVHNPSQAKYVDGCAMVVIAGHLHEPEQYRLPRGTLVSVAGTTGASGVEGLNPQGRYFAELLRFDGETLRAIDVVEMNPTTGEVTVRRLHADRIDQR